MFLEVWKNGKHEYQEAHLKSYLFNSVRNRCLNHIRHEAVIKKHADHEITLFQLREIEYFQSGARSLIEHEEIQTLIQAIDSLSPQSKEVIELSRFEELKNSEIAEKLNIPERTVETRLFRALSRLRDIHFLKEE